MLNDKAFSLPHNSYSFISQVFNDSMAVDKLAAVRYLLLCEYPDSARLKGLHGAILNGSKLLGGSSMFFLTVARQSDTSPLLRRIN